MRRDGDKCFLLKWKSGKHKEQYVYGRDIAEACNNAGIGRGALPALDWWQEVDDREQERNQHGQHQPERG